MAYLFLDNRGRATVYDKKELVPGGMKVILGTRYNGQTVNLNVFFTGVQVSRKASRQIRKALDRSFHIFQFGEDTSDIVLQGMAIAESQANYNYTSNDATNAFFEKDNTTKSAVEAKLREMGDIVTTNNVWLDSEGNPIYEGIAKKSENPDANYVTRFFQSVRDKAYTPGQDNSYTKVLGWVNNSIDNVKKYAISPIVSVIPQTVKTIKHLLGISEPDNMLDTRQVDMKIGTITELNAFFRAFNSGNHSSRMVVSICGIPVEGLMDRLTFQSLPKGQGYSFSLAMTGLKFYDGLVKNSYIDPQVLHPVGGNSLTTLLEGGKNMVFNAARTNSSSMNRIL